MKKLIVLLVVALSLSGCATTGTTTAPLSNAQFAANIIQPIVEGVVPLVLNKNPDLAPAFDSVANALPFALGDTELTPANIATTIAALNPHGTLTPEVQSLLASTLSIIVLEYQQKYGPVKMTGADPNVALMLHAFSNGLHNGVTVWQASHK